MAQGSGTRALASPQGREHLTFLGMGDDFVFFGLLTLGLSIPIALIQPLRQFNIGYILFWLAGIGVVVGVVLVALGTGLLVAEST